MEITITVNPSWGMGILLELLGTGVNVLGKQCVRYAQLTGRINVWLLGVLLFSVIYPFFDVLALSYAPESTVFAVDGMIVVWNVLLAPYTLGEPVTRSKFIAAMVVTAGTLGAGAFGSKRDAAKTSAGYLSLLCKPSAIFYYVLACAVAGGAYYLCRRYDPRSRVGGLWQGVLAGWCAGCAFFLKVLLTFVHEGAWASAWLYIFALLSISYQCAAVLGLSIALRRHEAVYIIPIYEGARGAVCLCVCVREGRVRTCVCVCVRARARACQVQPTPCCAPLPRRHTHCQRRHQRLPRAARV